LDAVANPAPEEPDGGDNTRETRNHEVRDEEVVRPTRVTPGSKCIPGDDTDELQAETIDERVAEHGPGDDFVAFGVFRSDVDEEFEDVFEGFNCTTLTVPCHCIPAYQNSDWNGYFTTIIDDCNNVPELDENMAAVYPNPTSGTIQIEAENIEAISIYNMLGEKLIETSTSGNNFEYDFSPHKVGIYIVKIQTKKGILTKRVMVKDK
jgi:hypothetical protein